MKLTEAQLSILAAASEERPFSGFWRDWQALWDAGLIGKAFNEKFNTGVNVLTPAGRSALKREGE